MHSDDLNKIDESIHKGIDYLYEHQLANGEFMTYWGPDEMLQEYCVPDSINFTTSLISNCLLKLQEMYKADAILKKTSVFLQYQMMRGGTWQFFTKWHKYFKLLPPDIDDTALAAAFLQKRNIHFDNNIPVLLANRNKDRLFYTWIVARPAIVKNKNYWLLALRELKNPISSLFFWLRNEHNRYDIDAIANANVLYYLGYNEATFPVADYLVDVLKNNKEATTDKWYLNPIVFYYFLSRLCMLHLQLLESMKHLLKQKIHIEIAKKGGIDNISDLETGLALLSFMNIGCTDKIVLKGLAKQLTQRQNNNGNWARQILYFGGPKKLIGWGCEELTTAFAVEALHAYKNYNNMPVE